MMKPERYDEIMARLRVIHIEVDELDKLHDDDYITDDEFYMQDDELRAEIKSLLTELGLWQFRPAQNKAED